MLERLLIAQTSRSNKQQNLVKIILDLIVGSQKITSAFG
jgi:hypothetical protein